MKSSRVRFIFQEGLEVKTPVEYMNIEVAPVIEDTLLKGLSVEVNHDDNDTPLEIVKKARDSVRDVLTLIGVGRGLKPTIVTTHIWPLSQTQKFTGIVGVGLDTVTVRQLDAMPDEDLVTQLKKDQQLRRQAEALNEAKATSDVISRIRWAYMVLEQEEGRNVGYRPLDEFRHIRNCVSHPEITTSSAGKAYFQSLFRVDFLDLANTKHMEFLKDKSEDIINEADKIVERMLADHKFWN